MRHPISLSVILLLLFTPPWSGEPKRATYHPGATIRVERVALFPKQPDRRNLGALTYLGGIKLIGNQRAFGGFSSMLVKGHEFTLLSDGGALVRFKLDADWRLSHVRFGDLPDGPGMGWRKADRDSESMTRDPKTGDIYVGFEVYNQLWRYSPDLKQALGHSAPKSMADWPRPEGAESLLRLKDGRYVIFAESGKKRGLRTGVMFAGDPVSHPEKQFGFTFRPPGPDFSPTAAAQLPDGRLLVLTRKFSPRHWFQCALVLVDLKAVKPGATVNGQVIARFVPPALSDNYEAMAVTTEGRDTIIWLASDDNQFFLQQSLLLKFRLEPARLTPSASRHPEKIGPKKIGPEKN